MLWSGATAIDTLSHLLLSKDSYKSQARKRMESSGSYLAESGFSLAAVLPCATRFSKRFQANSRISYL